MVSPNVNKILQQAQSLTLEERQQFLELLKSQAAAQTDVLKLVPQAGANGATITSPPKPTPQTIAKFAEWKPIQVPGGSLSDDLIRDRR